MQPTINLIKSLLANATQVKRFKKRTAGFKDIQAHSDSRSEAFIKRNCSSRTTKIAGILSSVRKLNKTRGGEESR